MQLIYYPDPRLLNVCPPVEGQLDLKERRALVASMFGVMSKHHGGVGLAAPQVGLNVRMFIWMQKEFGQAIWNPVLSCLSGRMESTEGCLSLPKVNVTIQRATSSIMTGIGVNGKPLRLIGDQNTTRIWQHEIDHLDGKLIIDNMSLDDRNSNRDAMRTLLKNTVA